MSGTGAGVGHVIAGRYRLVERIGSGGMGTVWLAEDPLLGRRVALKTMHASADVPDGERTLSYERTRREARSAGRVNHPNVVVVHDVVDDGGKPCIVMEYVPSRTLGDVLRQRGPVAVREAVRIGRGMVAALRAAHAVGVLHRDVKPGNVLLRADGRVVLTDFGIAVVTGTSPLTRTGDVIGSVDYVSPERFRGGAPSAASDLWALGVTLYEAVEGRLPFRKDTALETAYAIAFEPLPPPSRGGGLAALIEQLLRKDPTARPSAERVERWLEDIAAQGAEDNPASPVQTPPAVTPAPAPAPVNPPRPGPGVGFPPQPVPRSRGSRRVAVWTAVAVLGVAVAVLGVASPALFHRAEEGRKSSGVELGRASTGRAGTGSPRPRPLTPPEGYHFVTERDEGLTIPLPNGWRRTRVSDSDLAYTDPARLVSLRISVSDLAASDQLQRWRDDEETSVREGKLPGYSRLRMGRTAYRGLPAAIWEFTFQGRVREFRAATLGFGRPGEKEYGIYLSGPSADWPRHQQVFDRVCESIQIHGER